MPRLIPKFIQRWVQEKHEEELRKIPESVKVIAESFYETDRWFLYERKANMGVGVHVFKDSKTERLIFVQTIPDLFPHAEPDISAPWIPDSDLDIRYYLDKEWKKSREKQAAADQKWKEDRAREEFEKAEQEFLNKRAE